MTLFAFPWVGGFGILFFTIGWWDISYGICVAGLRFVCVHVTDMFSLFLTFVGNGLSFAVL